MNGEEQVVIEAIKDQENGDEHKILPKKWDMKGNKQQPNEIQKMDSREDCIPSGGETTQESCERHQDDDHQENGACDAISREDRVVVLLISSMKDQF